MIRKEIKTPYVITDVFQEIIESVCNALSFSVYSYYGYVEELNETLIQKSGSEKYFLKKFPLVWLTEPFVITEDAIQNYGRIKELRMFIMVDSSRDYKAHERKEKTFKPKLYPIRDELMKQFPLHKAFSGYGEKLKFSITDRYYWGENQQSVLNDVVDTIEVRLFDLKVNKPECFIQVGN